MEKSGFRVSAGTYKARAPGYLDVPTVDVDREDMPHLNGTWIPYDYRNSRERVWALILASRQAVKKFAPH